MLADLIVPTGDRNAFLVSTNLYRVRFYAFRLRRVVSIVG
jgi:hypothetical protein